MTESLTIVIERNIIYHSKNTDSKLIDIANCKPYKNLLFVVEYAILIGDEHQTPISWAIYECIDGPSNNSPNSARLGDFNQTVPKLMVWVYWQPGLPNWQMFSLTPDLDWMWQCGLVGNTKRDQERHSLTVDVSMCKTLTDDYNAIALLHQWEEWALAAVHSQQSATPMMIFNNYWKFHLLKSANIKSLIHHCDLSLCAWIEIEILSLRTTEDIPNNQ